MKLDSFLSYIQLETEKQHIMNFCMWSWCCCCNGWWWSNGDEMCGYSEDDDDALDGGDEKWRNENDK